jgi:3D (Asp-Asp-Asp) domain-containing protein
MMHSQTQPVTVNRNAQRLFLALCMVFGVAVCGAATVQATNPKQPVVRFVNDLPAAASIASDKAPVIHASITTPDTSLLVAVAPSKPAYQPTRTLMMEVTAYCACKKCCGPNAQGLTASGKPVSYNDSKFVAADTRVLPFGTKIRVPGYAGDESIEVIDRGGAIKGNKLDLFFPTHEAALEWGRQFVAVTIEE